MATALPPPAWSVGTVIERAYGLARDNFAAFVTVTMVFSAVSLVVDVLSLGLLAGLVHLATGAATAVCLTWGALRALAGDRPDWESMLRQVQGPRFWTILLLGMILYVAIGLSAILVIPPFFLLPLWSVAIPAMMVERCDVGAAFGRSADLTRGRRLQILGVFVVTVLAVIVGCALVLAVFGTGAIGSLALWLYGAVVSTFVHTLAAILYTLLLGEKDGVTAAQVAAALD